MRNKIISGKSSGWHKYFHDNAPVEVLATEDVVVSEEALAVQGHVAVVAPHAVHVPRVLQHRQQEPAHVSPL